MKTEALLHMQTAIRHLATAVANARLYSGGHGQVRGHCEEAQQALEALLRERPEVSLLTVEGKLLFDNMPFPATLHGEKFLGFMERHGMNRLVFRRGLRADELEHLVDFWARHDGIRHDFPRSLHLRFEALTEAVAVPERPDGPVLYTGKDGVLIDEEKKAGQKQLEALFAEVVHKHSVNVAGLYQVVGGLVEAFSNNILSLLNLLPIRTMNEYTFTHSLNVCLLNLAQAMNLGIGGELLHDIGLAALLHDVGKLKIPLEIIIKPGKLDEQEWMLMHQHPAMGAALLADSPGVPPLAVIAAFEHHMRHDYRGYPTVPGHWSQHLCSQMTAISDIYDALRTMRPYKEARSAEVSAGILRLAAGSEIHPQLAANFISLIEQATGPETAEPG